MSPYLREIKRIRIVEEARAEMLKKIFEGVELLANAGQSPSIALRDLWEAQERVERAIDAFARMDPEEYAEAERIRYATPTGTNHTMTEDQRLDDPRHGQAESLNSGRY